MPIDQPPLPPDDADALTWLLFRQDQVISRRQALRFLSRKTVETRLRSGRWRAARGVYLTHTGQPTRQQRRWIAVLAAGTAGPAVLAGLSALASYGLRGHSSEAVHVLIPAGSRDRDPPRGVVVHRTSTLSGPDVHRIGQPPRTLPARSLVDAAQWAGSDDAARAIVAAGFQQRLVDLAEVTAVLDRLPRAHRRALTRQSATDAAGGAHSLPEAEFRRLCRRAGLPEPTRQVRRRDARGRVLRFPSWAIRHRPDEVIAQLRAALVAAGWRPTTRHSRDLGRAYPR